MKKPAVDISIAKWYRKSKPVLLNFVLILLSVFFAFGTAEILIRFRLNVWPFEPPAMKIPYLTKKDANLRWRFSQHEGRNSLGLRNEEIMPKDRDSLRILFLGDSLVWIGETSSGELYTEVMEKRLNVDFYPNKKIDIINAGIPGYTTFQELEFLNQYGWDMQPDFVILGFVFNDVYFKYLHWPRQKSNQKRMRDLDPEICLHRFDTSSGLGRIFKRSFLAHETWYAVEKMMHESREETDFPFEKQLDLYLAWKDYGWKDTDILIRTMSQQLKARNIPLLIVIFPIRDQVNNKYLFFNRKYVLSPQKKIIDISKRYNIPYVDLTQELYKNGGIKLFNNYLHLNRRGNDVVADVLTRYLENHVRFFKSPGSEKK